MFWSSSETPAKEGDKYGVPKTPGAAAWALKAVPTLFFGTPKPPKDCENDQIFADLTQDIKQTSSGKGVEYEEAQAPSTPNMFATRQQQQGGGGILKTPGTAGPAKNVSFAPGHSLDESTMEESPTVRQKGRKIERIRSGLPHNFPGKFPSPWTPRVIQPQDVDNNDADDKDTFDLDEMKKLLTTIEQNNKILEKRVSKTGDESLDPELIPKLRLQIEQAVDYARLRDKECLDHQAKLAEAMTEHTKLVKEHKKLCQELDAKSVKTKDTSEAGEEKSDNEKLKKLELENREKSGTVQMLKEQVQELNVKLTMAETEANSGKSRDQEVEMLHEQLRGTESDVSRLREEVSGLKIDNEKLSRMNEQLETENSKLKHNQNQQATRELEEAKQRIQQLESELDSGNQVTLESSRLQAELANTQRRSENEKEQLRSHYETELNKLNARIREHESSVKERDERLTKLQATQSDLQGHVNLLREKIGKQNAEIERTSSVHTKEVSEKQEEIQRLRKEKQYLDDQLNGLIEQKAKLTNQVSNLEGQLRQQQQIQKQEQQNVPPSIHAFNGNRDSLLANYQKSYLGLYDSANNKPSPDTNTNPKPSLFNKPSLTGKEKPTTTKTSLFASPSTQSDSPFATTDEKKPSLFDEFIISTNNRPTLFNTALTKPSPSANPQPELQQQTTRSASYSHNDKENQPTKLDFASLPSQYTRAFSPAKSETENLISLESSADFKPPPEPSPMKDIETHNTGQSIREISMKDVSYSSNSSGSILGDADREQASFRRLAERRKRNQLNR